MCQVAVLMLSVVAACAALQLVRLCCIVSAESGRRCSKPRLRLVSVAAAERVKVAQLDRVRELDDQHQEQVRSR